MQGAVRAAEAARLVRMVPVAGSNERIYRSLRGLEKTASTSRVLNLAALAVRNAGNPEHSAQPLFRSRQEQPVKGKGSYRREAFQSKSWEASYFLAA